MVDPGELGPVGLRRASLDVNPYIARLLNFEITNVKGSGCRDLDLM